MVAIKLIKALVVLIFICLSETSLWSQIGRRFGPNISQNNSLLDKNTYHTTDMIHPQMIPPQ